MLNSSILNCGEKTNKKIIMGTVIGLVIGLALGIFISVLFISPIHLGAGINNQVQVSGTVSATQNSTTIEFVSLNGTVTFTVPITNGRYSVLLVGGLSYNVHVKYYAWEGGWGWVLTEKDYTTFIPLGVTTFTANF